MTTQKMTKKAEANAKRSTLLLKGTLMRDTLNTLAKAHGLTTEDFLAGRGGNGMVLVDRRMAGGFMSLPMLGLLVMHRPKEDTVVLSWAPGGVAMRGHLKEGAKAVDEEADKAWATPGLEVARTATKVKPEELHTLLPTIGKIILEANDRIMKRAGIGPLDERMTGRYNRNSNL